LRAISTGGGMMEVLNVDGDTGGYNLQWAFSSGFAAAKKIQIDIEVD
jgi:hypothetical protein